MSDAVIIEGLAGDSVEVPLRRYPSYPSVLALAPLGESLVPDQLLTERSVFIRDWQRELAVLTPDAKSRGLE